MVKIPDPFELIGAAVKKAPKFDAEAYRIELERFTTAQLRKRAEAEGVPNLHSRLGKGDYVNRLIMHKKKQSET